MKKFITPLSLFQRKKKSDLWLRVMFLFIILFPGSVIGQDKSTLSGFIKDAKTGETLIGATVYVSDINQGTVTNTYGYYSLSIPKGIYQVSVHYLGYDPIQKELELNSDQEQLFLLQPSSFAIGEVVVTGNRVEKEHVESTRTGVETISPRDVEFLPDVFGEKDIIKVFQLSSGVKSGNEGFSNMYVRGGRSDQNLIILDEAPVYNIMHVGGLFSVFNSDAIKNATLIKGAMPSRFGGRLSSLLDIQMKDGNNQELHGQGGLGILSSRFMLEGPLKKGRSSFMVSGRRSYIDALLAPIMSGNRAYFYDLNTKFNTWIGNKDRLFVSAYLGRDVLRIVDGESGMDLNWGNKTATVRWNHLFNKKLFSNVSVIYSNFEYYIAPLDKNGDVAVIDDAADGAGLVNGGIEDINAKIDFEYYLAPKFTLKYGISSIYHRFTPGSVNRVNNYERQPRIHGFESALYLTGIYQPSEVFTLEAGIRYNDFSIVGPYDAFSAERGVDLIHTKHYDAGELVDQFNDFQPRLSMVYLLNESSSLKASYSKNSQNIHTLSTFKFSSPLSLHVPSVRGISPSYADQYSIGYYRNLFDDKWQFSAEAYYKELFNQKDLMPGTDTYTDNVIENVIEGDGSAYGIELSAKKMKGRLTGWVNYTYSRAWQKVGDLNNGEKYPAFQDRPHDVNIVLMYKLSKRVNVAAIWVYQTGQPYSLPIAHFRDGRVNIPIYSSINGERYKDYHRLDLNISVYSKKSMKRKFKSYWSFGMYNVYGRKNAMMHSFGRKKKIDELGRNGEISKAAVLMFVPTITYNFKF
ncbi:MAG: TonB-dependent receptor domain-containing protein [Hyphomicrobiales bacterium]